MTLEQTRRRHIVGIGELLWDMLPNGPQLGGAPSNFCVMAARFGDHAVIASRVGEDQPISTYFIDPVSTIGFWYAVPPTTAVTMPRTTVNQNDFCQSR